MHFLKKKDQDITTWLNRLADRSRVATYLVNVTARWFIVLFFFLAVWFLWDPREPFLVLRLLVHVTASWGVTTVIGLLVDRKRPYEQKSDPVHLDPWVKTPSFPSGHATAAFAIATSMAAMLEWPLPLSISAFAIAGIIALSRVIVGVHFVSDILAGAVIGTLLSLLWM